MCVICAKPKNVPMPSEETIANMWTNNPDGAGIMYAKDGVVHIRKGYMSYNAFCKALDDLRKENDLEKLSVVMHFRITTHGGTKPENCHPFPVTESLGMLQKRKTLTNLGVAHNGIIHNVPRKGISDTMEYVISQLGPLQKAVPDFYKNADLMQMVSNAIDSKMVFLDHKGNIYTIGNFEEKDHIKYSNSSYKGYRWSKLSSFSCYEDDDWDDYWEKVSTSGNKRTSYSYREKSLMWLSDEKGEYVKKDNGEYDIGDYAIDAFNKVYAWSPTMSAMIPKAGYVAFNSNGSTLKYDFKSNMVTFEAVYEPLYLSGGSRK